jgi:hypothetical protein
MSFTFTPFACTRLNPSTYGIRCSLLKENVVKRFAEALIGASLSLLLVDCVVLLTTHVDTAFTTAYAAALGILGLFIRTTPTGTDKGKSESDDTEAPTR